jgi:hypothetical protein
MTVGKKITLTCAAGDAVGIQSVPGARSISNVGVTGGNERVHGRTDFHDPTQREEHERTAALEVKRVTNGSPKPTSRWTRW